MSMHQIVDSATHREQRVLTGHGGALGDGVMACLTVPGEFRRVQAHFPIVFRRDLTSGAFSAWALFGFEEGENLFLAGTDWQANYKPLALAIQPFLIGRGSGGGQVHIDMAHPRAAAGNGGVRLFDDLGLPSPYLEAMAERLGDLDQGYQDSPAFFAALERHSLLEPFTLQVPLNDGSNQSLVGFHTLDEGRLMALDGAALAELHGAGHLLPLFMAAASLSQFGALVDRKNAVLGHG